MATSTRFRERSWSVAPGAWSAEAGEGYATLEPPTRDAALQISASRKPAGDVTDADLAEFAEDADPPGGVAPAACGDFRGLRAEYAVAGVRWRKWWLGAGPVLLHATYNADEPTAPRDTAAVDAILATLRHEPGAHAA